MAVQIPSDEQLLQELRGKIAVLSAPHHVAKYGPPDVPQLLAQRRQWHADKPKRDAAEAKAKAQQQKEQARAEQQYVRELKRQGKPVIKQEALIAQYPTVHALRHRTMTQPELQRYAELLGALGEASRLHHEGQAIVQQYFAPGRKKFGELVAKAYGLYLQVQASALKDEILEQAKAILKQRFSITAHRDTPDGTVLIKLIFPSMSAKSAHQYGRALEFARSYGVLPEDYAAFITEYGGYEKIRGAYAKVAAADSGRLLPLQKQAATGATWQFVSGLGSMRQMQLTEPEGTALRAHQSQSGYCYLIAHVDMHNHLEIVAPIPLTDVWEQGVIKHIAQMAKELPEWQEAYDRNYAAVVKNANRAAVEKMARQQQKAEHRAKRSTAQQQRGAAFKRKAARQRAKAGNTDLP